jgi:hypothetical protein
VSRRDVQVIDDRYDILTKENVELKRQLVAISSVAK